MRRAAISEGQREQRLAPLRREAFEPDLADALQDRLELRQVVLIDEAVLRENSCPGGRPLKSSTMVSATLWPVRSRSSSRPVSRST